MERLAAAHENIRLACLLQPPDSSERKGADYHHEGRVCVELFKELLPSNNYEFFSAATAPS